MEKLYLFHFSLCLFPSLVLGITFFSVFCGLRYVIILVIYFYNFALYKFFWVIDAVVNILKTNIKLNRIWTMMTFLTYEIGLKGRVLQLRLFQRGTPFDITASTRQRYHKSFNSSYCVCQIVLQIECFWQFLRCSPDSSIARVFQTVLTVFARQFYSWCFQQFLRFSPDSSTDAQKVYLW